MGIRNGRFKPDQVRAELLTVLERWGRLVESDLKRMMDVALALRVDSELRQRLEQENLVRVEQAGDEFVFTITEAGRRWLEAYRQRRTGGRRPKFRSRRRGRSARESAPTPNQEQAPGPTPVEIQTAPGSER
jgi:hypothetical protein